jgi:hypothetical protein
MRAARLLLALSALVSLDSLSAQRQPTIHAGARVRISAPSEGYRGLIGTVSGYDGGDIVIKPGNEQSSVSVPLTSITTFKRSRGLKSNAGQGALIGSIVGGAFGALFAAATYRECVGEGWDCLMHPESAGQAAVYGGTILGLLGAGIGALIGANEKTERWEEVPLDQVRVSIVPHRDGRFAFGLSVSF